MPVSAKAIKTRIKSVKNTQKITKAMEMVSASKMRRAVEQSLASRPYSELALELLVNISKDRLISHPLLRKEQGNKTLLVIVTSNKGLCGGFHVNIFKELQKYIKGQIEKGRSISDIHVVAVGKYAERFAKKLKLTVVASFIEIPDTLSIEELSGLTSFIKNEFLAEKYDRVRLVYSHYVSAISNEVRIRGILPVKAVNVEKMVNDISDADSEIKTDDRSLALYGFEPSEEDVLNQVLPRLTEVLVYQAVLEARASEHSSRMMAMKNASENAGEMIDELSLYYNKARQAGITQEIVEIATGAQALASN